MIDRTIARAGAASGIVYVLVIFTSPGLFAGDTARRVELVGMLFLLPFLGYLWRVLRAAESAEGWLSMTALISGLSAITIKIASAAPLLAADKEADGTQLHDALVSVNDASFILTMLPLGVMAAAAAIVTLRTGVLPRWLGWLAAVAAAALVVNGLSFHSQEGPAFLLFALWLLATSVVLSHRAGARESGATRTQPNTGRATGVEA
jgi:Ca2+/Na+ antiporter